MSINLSMSSPSASNLKPGERGQKEPQLFIRPADLDGDLEDCLHIVRTTSLPYLMYIVQA